MLKEAQLVALGKEGEHLAANVIKRVFGNTVRMYNNLYFKDDKDHPYQIDSLVLTPWGLMVIEVKHWSGITYGDLQEQRWHYRARGKYVKTRSIYSPIKQNRGHMTKLRALLGRQLPMRSCIVFTHPSAILELTPKTIPNVFTLVGFEDFLVALSKGNKILSDDALEQYHSVIMSSRHIDQGTVAKQVAFAKKTKRRYGK